MTWVRREDTASIHRKVAPLDDATYRLWSEALEWCSRNGTDGRIAVRELAAVSKRGSRARAATLVAQDLWHEADVVCGSENCPPGGPDGWVIHDYLDYQPARADVVAEKRAKAERQKRWRDAKTGRLLRNGQGDASHDAPHDRSRDGPRDVPVTPTPSRPVPSRPEGSGTGRPGQSLPTASALAARSATTNGAKPTGERCHDCGNALTSAYHLGPCAVAEQARLVAEAEAAERALQAERDRTASHVAAAKAALKAIRKGAA